MKRIENWVNRQDERLRCKLGGLSPKMKIIVVLAMFAVFALCAFFTLAAALYRIGRNDGRQIEIEHIKQLDLRPKQDSISDYKYYDYGTKQSRQTLHHIEKI